MTEELTLRVTDIERKAITFCKEKEITFPIANHLVEFATEATKELQESLEEWQKTCEAKSDTNSQLIKQLADKNEQIEKMKCCGNCKHCRYSYGELECATKDCKKRDKWELKEN